MKASYREPAVAGLFYPGDPDDLRHAIASYGANVEPKIRALGCVVPHAGYVYSGHVAGAVFSRLELPKRFIILCPNHTGYGVPLSIMSEGAWRTPLGDAQVDQELAEALKNTYTLLEEDDLAHRKEHAIEVQLPFLQASVAELRFVPIAVGTGNIEALRGLGEAIASVLNAQQLSSEQVLVIASSDMNHYESDKLTRAKDHLALESLLALDARGLYDTVMNERISMCGYGPAVATLTATRALGAHSAQLIKYATSAEVSGDFDRVVGYAGVIIS